MSEPRIAMYAPPCRMDGCDTPGVWGVYFDDEEIAVGPFCPDHAERYADAVKPRQPPSEDSDP